MPAFAQNDTIVNGSSDGHYGYIIINTTPAGGATVLINGEIMPTKTPFVSNKLEYGYYNIMVVRDSYEKYIDSLLLDEAIKVIDFDYSDNYLIVKRSIREKGLCLRTEVEAGVFKTNSMGVGVHGENDYCYYMYDNKDIYQERINATLGYYEHPYIFCGIGFGICNFNKSLSIPLYVNPRIYLSNRLVSTYIDLRMGFIFNAVENDKYKPDRLIHGTGDMTCEISCCLNGLLIGGGIGIDYKHSNLGLSIYAVEYEMKQPTWVRTDMIGGIMLHYGYNFYNVFKHKTQ